MRQRTITVVAATSLAALTIVCAFGFPALLMVADHWWQPNWVKLANIGQAYGAASAVFSAVAVVGIAASLIYQSHTVRLQRVQIAHDKHERLLMQVMEDPDT